MDLPNLGPGDERQVFHGHGAFHLGLGVSGRLASTATSAVTAGAEATAATMRCKQKLTLCYERSPIRTARCHSQLCKQISRQSSMEQCMLEWFGAGMAVKAAACAAELDGLGPAIQTSSPLPSVPSCVYELYLRYR